MNFKGIVGLVIGTIAVAVLAWWYFSLPNPRMLRFEETGTETSSLPFSYQDYAAVLAIHVDERGMVNYQKLGADRSRLDRFASRFGYLKTAEYERWSQSEQLGFWINAYNALTLEAILHHYPIKPNLFRSLISPRNSIRQIPGVWDTLQFSVLGQWTTLNQIEHEILRRRFSEPRIHMALVCASNGCPPLRNEPFVGERLNQQLEDQVRRFLSSPQKFRIDRSREQVYLSAIFKWFSVDFLKAYGTDQGFSGFGQTERAVLNFISHHLNPNDAAYLAGGRYKIEYFDYDWSLNEQGRAMISNQPPESFLVLNVARTTSSWNLSQPTHRF